jgi:hypothetical protein
MDTSRIPKEKIGAENIVKEIKQYQEKWLQHIQRMDTSRIPKEKIGAENIVKEIKQYQEKWLQHIQRMGTNRIPKQELQYKPKGRRHIGRPRKRWRDQLHFVDTMNRNQT